MASRTADPPGYNISDEEEQQQQQQQQQQDEEEYNARRRNRNSMFVDDLRSKKRHLEAKQQQRTVIIAASSDWVPERLKTIDRGNPNQPKNIHMSKQTKEIHRNSIPRTSWEPYSIPKKQTKDDSLKSKAFQSTTNDWVPSKYYSKNNSNKNLHPQLNRNSVVTSSYPPIPLVTTSSSNSNSTASQSTTLANNNSINNISRTNIVETVSSSNSDIEYDIETVNSDSDSLFEEYTEYNDNKSTKNGSNNVLLTDHFKVNDDDINAGVSFTVDKAKIDVSKRSLITTDFTESFAFTSFNTTGSSNNNNNNNNDKTSSDDSSSYVIEISDCSSGGDNFASFASFPSAAAAAPAPGARTSTDPPTTTAAAAAAALAAWSARSLYSSSASSSSLSPNNNNENENENDDNNSNNSGIPQSVSTLIMIKRKRDFLDFRCCCRVIDEDDDKGDNEQDNNSSDDDDDDDDDEKDNNGDRRQQRNQRQRQRQRHGRICQPLSCGVWMIVSLSIVLLLIWIAIGIGWYFMKPFE